VTETPRLYLDEDSCDTRLIEALRRADLDVLAATTSGNIGLPDERQLEIATREGRTLVTANYIDFAVIHARWAVAGKSHPGILIWTQGVRSQEATALLIGSLLAGRSAESLANAMVWA